VFIFAAGALTGFYLMEQLLARLAEETLGRTKPIERYDDRARAGAGRDRGGRRAGGGVAARRDPRLVSWLAGPLAATVVYLLFASLQLAVVGVRRR
jgi:hypothetical protein